MSKKNETKDYKFTVKNTYGDPFITMEPMRGEISIFKNAILAFHLRETVSEVEALEVVKMLNEIVRDINYQKI